MPSEFTLEPPPVRQSVRSTGRRSLPALTDCRWWFESLLVPISADTGLDKVHPTRAGTYILDACVFLFPAINFALIDSDCVPVTLFEDTGADVKRKKQEREGKSRWKERKKRGWRWKSGPVCGQKDQAQHPRGTETKRGQRPEGEEGSRPPGPVTGQKQQRGENRPKQ